MSGRKLPYVRLGREFAYALIDQILAGMGENDTSDVQTYVSAKNISDLEALKIQAAAEKHIERALRRLKP